jgi:hypothetical protein
MEKTITAIAKDGSDETRVFDTSTMSIKAKWLARQLNNGSVELEDQSINLKDLVAVSQYHDREIAVVQSQDLQRMRLVRGQDRRVSGELLKKGEFFLIHTHPTFKSFGHHFEIDRRDRGSLRWEAVVDWSGKLIVFRDQEFKNRKHDDRSYQALSPTSHDWPTEFITTAGVVIGHRR